MGDSDSLITETRRHVRRLTKCHLFLIRSATALSHRQPKLRALPPAPRAMSTKQRFVVFLCALWLTFVTLSAFCRNVSAVRPRKPFDRRRTSFAELWGRPKPSPSKDPASLLTTKATAMVSPSNYGDSAQGWKCVS